MSNTSSLTAQEKMQALTKFVPPNQPSARAYIELVNKQTLGVDKKGVERPFEDLLYFLNVCHRTQLNPLAKQIYAVYRWDWRQGKEVMSIQVGIDGLRTIAHRTGLYAGQDDIEYDTEAEAHPNRATATVYRINPKNGEPFKTQATARWAEYVQKDKNGQPMGMWSTDKMPFNQLGKCAEALALRKAFPQDMSGLYIEEEMQQADNKPAIVAPKPVDVVEGEATEAKEEKPAKTPKPKAKPVKKEEVDDAQAKLAKANEKAKSNVPTPEEQAEIIAQEKAESEQGNLLNESK